MEGVPPSVLHKVESGLRIDVDEFLLSVKRSLERQLQELIRSVQNRLVEEFVDDKDARVPETLGERPRAAGGDLCNISDSAFAISISSATVGSCPLHSALPKLALRCPAHPASAHDCIPGAGVPSPRSVSQPPQIASSRIGFRSLASQHTPAVTSTRPLQRPPPPRHDEARLPALPDAPAPNEHESSMGGLALEELSNIPRMAAAASPKSALTNQRADGDEMPASGKQEGGGSRAMTLKPTQQRISFNSDTEVLCSETLEVGPEEHEEEEEEDGEDHKPGALANRRVGPLTTMAISRKLGYLSRSVSPSVARSSSFSDTPKTVPSRWKIVVEHHAFEVFFSVIIILNCASMGIEAHEAVSKEVPPTLMTLVNVLEVTCTSLFVIEIVLRWWVYGIRKFVPNTSEGAWRFLDAALAFAGALSTFIVPLIGWIMGSDSDKNSLVRTLVSLRAIRLVRLVRVVRQVSAFKEVWMLLQGLASSIRTLFWTVATIFFLTYIFAIFGCYLIATPITQKYTEETDPSKRQMLEEMLTYVGGLDKLMMTLIQLLTLDSWNGFARLIRQVEPYSIYFWYLYVAVGVLVLSNLVTAIIVDNAMETSRKDQEVLLKAKEAEKHKELAQVQILFGLMDADQDGCLSWDEFKLAFNDPELGRRWRMLDLRPQDCKEIFNLLDDGDGTIDRDEFFEGLAKLKGSASSRDVYRLQKTVDKTLKLLESRWSSELLSPKTPLGRPWGS